MAEILTEQIEALREARQKSKHTTTADGKQEDGKQEKNAKLPKGMILDKDGKPSDKTDKGSPPAAAPASQSPTGAPS
ncbi:hypothetical protein EMPG_13793 [Blastomyces silverae]|uniref:Uncharacterized protein n=1 Tax=Blastomyces silverae TaxID=2060906 RepID=A0A0H1BID2_9EURO|nr:hypothetical protein EMPG_13793 [Blastomyces silverae]